MKYPRVFWSPGCSPTPGEYHQPQPRHLTMPVCSVADAAVVSVPDSEHGHLPRAFVVLRGGHEETEENLINFLESRLQVTRVTWREVVMMTGAGPRETARRPLLHPEHSPRRELEGAQVRAAEVRAARQGNNQ